MKKYADLYGSALPLQYTIERNELANMNREGPMKSNNFGIFLFFIIFLIIFICKGLNIHAGLYDTMSFNDYIGTNKMNSIRTLWLNFKK